MKLNSFSNTESECSYSDHFLDESIFTPGTEEYRQARKRRQNRESAGRIRAQKRKDLEEIQKKITNLSDFNSNLQLELFKLKIENEKLRAESTMTEKGSQLYSKIAISLCIFFIFCLQIYNTAPLGASIFSQTWLYILSFLIPLLIILIK